MSTDSITDLVSVVVPVYNRGDLLAEVVENVLSQSWPHVELIIVDDGSTDDTLAAARAFSAVKPDSIKVVARANGGPGAARQTGVEHSRGEFVQFLDSDDLLMPGKLECQVLALKSDPDAGIAYGRTLLEEGDTRRHAPEMWRGEPYRELMPTVLIGRLWDTSNPLYRREALRLIGPWSNRRQLEDWEFDCRAGRSGVKLHYCNADLTIVRSHATNRLGREWMRDPSAMRDRLWAFERVLEHAQASGVSQTCQEFKQLVRSIFLMARIAGSRGYLQEADRLFALAKENSPDRRFEFFVFEAARRTLGWTIAVALGERMRPNGGLWP